MSLAVVNLGSVLKLKGMVMAAAQHVKRQRSTWGGTLNRAREELAEAGERRLLLCVCVCARVRTSALIEKKCLTPLKLANNSCFSDFWRRKEETSNDWFDLDEVSSLFEIVLFLLAPVFPC